MLGASNSSSSIISALSLSKFPGSGDDGRGGDEEGEFAVPEIEDKDDDEEDDSKDKGMMDDCRCKPISIAIRIAKPRNTYASDPA